MLLSNKIMRNREETLITLFNAMFNTKFYIVFETFPQNGFPEEKLRMSG